MLVRTYYYSLYIKILPLMIVLLMFSARLNTLRTPLPFASTSFSMKIHSVFPIRCRASSERVILPCLQLEHTRLAVLTVSPIRLNYGLCAPITPAITLP